MLLQVFPDNKEGGFGLEPFQDFQDPWGIQRMGAIIKGQGNSPPVPPPENFPQERAPGVGDLVESKKSESGNGGDPENHTIKLYGGKMKSICQTYLKPDNFLGDIDLAIDNGANAIYIQGAEGDKYVREGKTDQLAKAIEYIKKKGYLAGMGAHSLEVIKACEKEKIPVDFYVKTFHNDNYWSAHPIEDRVEFSVDTKRYAEHNKIHDNMFDLFPVKTMEYMKEVNKPWIAFKVLAGGAILPKEGFRFAFENGADFICVGMFDFQVVDDVNIASAILANLKKRERKWYS